MGKGKNVLTTGEVARICNVAPRTVSKWFDSGKLRGYRIPGSRDRRIPVDELSRFMKQHNIPAHELLTNTTRILMVGHWLEQQSEMVSALAEQGGYEVQTVGNTFQLGVTLVRFAPHVILINVDDPDLDAQSLCTAIRSDEESQGVRVVAFVEHASVVKTQELLRSGFDDYVTSADPHELIKCIEQVVAIIY